MRHNFFLPKVLFDSPERAVHVLELLLLKRGDLCEWRDGGRTVLAVALAADKSLSV